MNVLVFPMIVAVHVSSFISEDPHEVSMISGSKIENVGLIGGDISSGWYNMLISLVAGSGYCKRASITMESASPVKEETTFARALTMGGLKFEYAMVLDRDDCYGKNDDLIFFRASGVDSSDRPLTRFLELLSVFRTGGDLADSDMVIKADDPQRLECLKTNKELGIAVFWRVVPAASDGEMQYVAIFSGCNDSLGRPMAAYIDYNEYEMSYKVEISFHFG